jgi:Lon protease-like protein
MCLARRRRSENEAPFYEYGVMLELMHVQTLADGRSIVEAVGSHRFKVTHSELIDGYHMAEIERVDDIDFEQEKFLEQQHILKASAARARIQQTEQPRVVTPQALPLSMTNNNRQLNTSRSNMLPMVGQRQSWAQQAHPQMQSQMKKAPWLQMHVRGLSAARSKPPMIVQQRPQQPVLHEKLEKHREIQSTEDILNDIVEFIEKLIENQHTNATFSTWLNALGESPVLRGPQRDRVALTWWFVNMMPLGEEEKYTLLPIRNFRERLLVIIAWVDRFQDQWSLCLNQPNSLPCVIS